MSNLTQRIERLEQAPEVQRDQRIAQALQSGNVDSLTDDELLYIAGQGDIERGERFTAWLKTVTDDDVNALAYGRLGELSADAQATLAEAGLLGFVTDMWGSI